MGGQHHAAAALTPLPPVKTRNLLYRRVGGPQGPSGRVRKILLPPGFDPRTVQLVANRYTNYAIPARHWRKALIKWILKKQYVVSLDWILVAKDVDQLQDVVNTVTKLRLP